MSNKKRKTSEVVFEYTGIEEDVPEDVTIARFHSSVTEVRNDMFKECGQLKEVVLNEGLQKIGSNSFYMCHNLEHVNLPSTLLEVSEQAFYYCNSLEDVVLNEGLQTIGNFAFYGCKSIKSIKFPSSITEVGEGAFCGCSRLKTVILNESLQTIGKAAFASCTQLERITIPHTVTEIRERTFFWCINLREVGLHEGIQTIAYNAFDECVSLERFTFSGLTTRLETIIGTGNYAGVDTKLDEIRGPINRRGSELSLPVSVSSTGGHIKTFWIRNRGTLGRIDRLLTYYELKEATMLLELAMWKSMIDLEEVKPINSDAYRIDIPGPVKNTILQYLNYRA